MPIYTYEHPGTGEQFEVVRSFAEADKIFKSTDGKKCKRIPFPASTKKPRGRSSRAGQKLEVFQADPDYCKKCNPKYVKFQDGHRERYDPTRHC